MALRTGESAFGRPRGLAQTSSWNFGGLSRGSRRGCSGEGVWGPWTSERVEEREWGWTAGRQAMEGSGWGLVKPGNGGNAQTDRRWKERGRDRKSAEREIQEIDDHGTGVSREREGEQI